MSAMGDLFRFLIVLISMVSLSACYDAASYRGDGHLVDEGRQEARSRYILTLGEIEVGKPGQFEFDLLGLPREDFVVGLEIELSAAERKENLEAILPCDPQVQIEVQDTSNNLMVLDVGGHLSTDWVWSTAVGDPLAFVYIRDGRFRPQSLQSRYEMRVRVIIVPDSNCHLRAVLVAKSPGWK